MALQGPRCQGNQAIAQRAQEDEEEQQREWSDDSDVSEAELENRVSELTTISKAAAARAAAVAAAREAAARSRSKTTTTASGKGKVPARRGGVANAINFELAAAGDAMHVIFVVDASLSMGASDVEWVDPAPELEMMPPRNVRRIDAVMLACRAFLQAHRSEPEEAADVFSLVTFNDAAHVLFERKGKKAADRQLEKAMKKASPVRDTRFQSAFRGIRSLLREESALEDVRVVLLSDGQPYEKNGVMKLFEELVQNAPCVRLLQNFEVHTIGFGVETGHWDNLRSLAEATKGTFQSSGLHHLDLTKSFTSVAATITSDKNSASAPPLKAASMEIHFDPDFLASSWDDAAEARPRRVIRRQCSCIEHKYQYRHKTWTDIEKQVCLSTEVTVDLTPFDCGGMRLVYGMIDGTYWREKMVAKRLIREPHACKDDMLHFCRCTSMAISMRNGFVNALRKSKAKNPYDLWFVKCYLYKYHYDGDEIGYFVAEQRLDGSPSTSPFTKFNGNNGYVNPKRPAGTELMQAFSHFSFIRSQGKLIVVDLQGILDNDTFLLTDPQVHSRNRLFGRGDFGVEGFEMFFRSHQCGETCKALGLEHANDELLRRFTLEKARRCQVCMDAPSKTILLPCKHSAVCETCAMKLLELRSVCPICRKKITEYRAGLFSSTYVRKQVSFA